MNQSASELIELGDKSFYRGDYRNALGWYEQAVAQVRRDKQARQELSALHLLSVTWGNIGDRQKEVEADTTLLARARQLQDEKYQMLAINELCFALGHIDVRNRWHEIRPLLLEGLVIARRLGNNTWEIVLHLKDLGFWAIRAGDEEQGYLWLQEALNTIRPKMKNANFLREEIYRWGLSYLMLQRGEYDEAVRYAEMAIGEAEKDGNPDLIASARLALAYAEWARDELGTALEIVEDVLLQARTHHWRVNEQRAEYLRSEIERALGHPDVAAAAARRALELVQESHLKEEEVKCLLSLGQALCALGEKGEGIEVLRRARRLSQELDYEDHFHKAEKLSAELPEEGEA